MNSSGCDSTLTLPCPLIGCDPSGNDVERASAAMDSGVAASMSFCFTT